MHTAGRGRTGIQTQAVGTRPESTSLVLTPCCLWYVIIKIMIRDAARLALTLNGQTYLTFSLLKACENKIKQRTILEMMKMKAEINKLGKKKMQKW